MHDGVLLRRRHPPVQDRDASFRKRLLQPLRLRFHGFHLRELLRLGTLDQGTNDEHLPAVRDLAIDETLHRPPVSVRGMGVAVIARKCGLPFSLRRWRCSTPKRCCSSTITKRKSLNRTDSMMSACVPMSRSTVPFIVACLMACASAEGVEPVSSAVRGSGIETAEPPLLC